MKTKIPEYQVSFVTSTLSRATIPTYVLNFFLWAPSTFPVAGSTWTTGLSAPGGLVAKDRSCVAFLVRFKVDDDCDAASEGGGGLTLSKNLISYVNECIEMKYIIRKLH